MAFGEDLWNGMALPRVLGSVQPFVGAAAVFNHLPPGLVKRSAQHLHTGGGHRILAAGGEYFSGLSD